MRQKKKHILSQEPSILTFTLSCWVTENKKVINGGVDQSHVVTLLVQLTADTSGGSTTKTSENRKRRLCTVCWHNSSILIINTLIHSGDVLTPPQIRLKQQKQIHFPTDLTSHPGTLAALREPTSPSPSSDCRCGRWRWRWRPRTTAGPWRSRPPAAQPPRTGPDGNLPLSGAQRGKNTERSREGRVCPESQ